MKKIFLPLLMVVISILFFRLHTLAQDPHFSQYYASQSTVNPAFTGMFTGQLKVSGLYRQQWAQYGSPFTTATIAFEIKPGKFVKDEFDNRFAIGAMLLTDKTPDGALQSNYAQLTAAYHKTIDENGFHRIGVGFMGGYGQRRLNISALTFSNQFTTEGFDTNISSGETFNQFSLSHWDVQAGILYSYEDENNTGYLGVSAYHLTKPKNYFIHQQAIDNTIPQRYNINAGINITGNNNLRYAASALYMNQGGAAEVLFGGAVGMPISNDGNNMLYAGSWLRLNESIIPTVNLQWNNMNIGLSYDVAYSNKTFTKPQSFELSIVWVKQQTYHTKTSCFGF